MNPRIILDAQSEVRKVIGSRGGAIYDFLSL